MKQRTIENDIGHDCVFHIDAIYTYYKKERKFIMKKKVLALLLATAMVATLVGCGKNDDASSNDDTVVDDGGAVEEKITCSLTVWAPSEDQSEDNPWLQTQCEAFAAEHQNWDITFTYGVCPEGEAKATVTQDVDAAADVFGYANDNLAELISAGAIAELGGTTAEFVTNNFGKTYVDSISDNGAVYGVPYESNTWFMYYNTSIYSAEDVKSLDTMLEKGVVMFPLTNSWYIEAFYLATGAEFFGGVNDNDAGINVGGDNGTKATNYLVDLVANKNFKNGEFGEALAGLTDGSIAAAFSGTWDREKAEEALGDNFGVAALPTINVDGSACQLKNFSGSKAWGVKATTAYPEVATALALYLGGESAQQARYEARGTIPALSSLATVLSEDPIVATINEVYANCSIMQPYCANMGNWWAPAGNMGTELIAGSITHDNAAAKTEAFNNAVNGN